MNSAEFSHVIKRCFGEARFERLDGTMCHYNTIEYRGWICVYELGRY